MAEIDFNLFVRRSTQMNSRPLAPIKKPSDGRRKTDHPPAAISAPKPAMLTTNFLRPNSMINFTQKEFEAVLDESAHRQPSIRKGLY
jgi:hypothetical protein